MVRYYPDDGDAQQGKRKTQEKGIAWRNSAAKFMILEDLDEGVLPLEEEAVSTLDAWEYYKKLDEFRGVPFGQFKRQLKAHREQVGRKNDRSNKQWAAFLHDQQLFPPEKRYSNGKRIFCLSPAQKLLTIDVKAGRHHIMSPTALRSTRHEYMEWGIDIFTGRIYQAERQLKFINYLEKKRAEKKKSFQNDEHDDDTMDMDDAFEATSGDHRKKARTA